MPCRLLVTTAFEITENDGRPIALGEFFDFCVNQTIEILGFHGLRLRPGGGHALFVAPPEGGGQAGARRRAKGNLMEPRAERVAHPQAARLPDQDQERGLESVVGFELAGQYTSADAENHRSVALDQDSECELGGLAAVGRKAFQKLAVGQVADDSDVEEGFELMNQGRALVAFHWRGFSVARAVRNGGPYECVCPRGSWSAPLQVMYRGALEVPRFWRIKAYDQVGHAMIRKMWKVERAALLACRPGMRRDSRSRRRRFPILW